jgi:hypothetical protein
LRSLHLIQPHPPRPHWLRTRTPDCSGESSLLACAALIRERAPGDVTHVVVFGGAGSADAAHSAGLRDCSRISPPLGDASRAAPLMRALLARTSMLDGVFCWGSGFRGLSRKVSHGAPWLEVNLRGASIHCMDATDIVREPRSAIEFAPRVADPSARARARARIGLRPGEVALTLLTDAPAPAHAPYLVACAMALHVAGCKTVVVLPALCEQRERAMRHHVEGAYITRAVATSRPVIECLQACDAALCAPIDLSQPPPECLRWLARCAMAGGTPVVAPRAWARHWDWPETLAPLVAASERPTHIAAALLPLLDSRAEMDAVSRGARDWALLHRTSIRTTLAQSLHQGAAP